MNTEVLGIVARSMLQPKLHWATKTHPNRVDAVCATTDHGRLAAADIVPDQARGSENVTRDTELISFAAKGRIRHPDLAEIAGPQRRKVGI